MHYFLAFHKISPYIQGLYRKKVFFDPLCAILLDIQKPQLFCFLAANLTAFPKLCLQLFTFFDAVSKSTEWVYYWLLLIIFFFVFFFFFFVIRHHKTYNIFDLRKFLNESLFGFSSLKNEYHYFFTHSSADSLWLQDSAIFYLK